MNIDSIINKLAIKSANRVDSVHLLKTLKKELREKTSSGNISIDEIKEVFQHIIEDTDLIECPTFIVRLYLASYFSDAFYIFVPALPVSTTGQLDAIFQLFSTVISFNCQEGTTEYTIIQNIIEMLNATDSYLLIINRDVSFEMIECMIKIKPISILNHYDSNFQNSIKFLVNLINASSSSLIITEVQNLFSINFNSSLIVQKVLPLLSQNMQMAIVGSFQQHLNYNDFMKAFVTATKILKMSFGFIIQMLYPELINLDDSQRMTVFSLLSEIFHHNKSDILAMSDSMDEKNDFSEDIKSINFILSRNVDKCPKIRLIVIQIASYLIESQNHIFYDNALKVIKSIHYDPNEAVRFAGLDIIWKLQKQSLLDKIKDKSNKKEIDDICTFLYDKSHRIREKTLMHMCELVKLMKENNFSEKEADSKSNCIDKIIVYCFEKPGTEIFMAYSFLFDIFDSTDLYEMTTEKTKYMKSLNFIKTTCEYVKKYAETGNLSNNNLAKLLTKEIWKPFVPNTKLLQIRKKYKTQDAIQVILKSTNEQFAKEFAVLTIDIPVNIKKIIYECSSKAMIKNFANFNPKLFLPYLSKILVRSNKECISILPFIAEYAFLDQKQDEIDIVNQIKDIFILLISVSTQDSLIVLAKLVSRWNYNFSSKKRIVDITRKDEKLIFNFDDHEEEIDYQKFEPRFSLKFFYFLAIPDIIPNFFTPKPKKEPRPKLPPKFLSITTLLSDYRKDDNEDDNKYDDRYVKWSLRISTLFDENEIVRIHFYFINSYPLQCLESLFRITNVISHEYTFSILLPNKSANDVLSHFELAQKKGENLLNLITIKQFRMIASLLINLGTDDGYNMSQRYKKMNEKFWIISMVDEALKNPKTPIEFLSLIVLGLAFDDNDPTLLNNNNINFNPNVSFNDLKSNVYEKARSSLAYHVNLRRKFANQVTILPPLIARSESELSIDQSDQVKKSKKSKLSSNDQLKDEKFIKSSNQNEMISDQQVELMIPSLFNVLAFFYYYRKHSIDYRNIINKLFDAIIFNDQQKSVFLYAVNEVRSVINPLSSFGKRMISICDYASSKVSIKQIARPVNFHINQKFVIDIDNEL